MIHCQNVLATYWLIQIFRWVKEDLSSPNEFKTINKSLKTRADGKKDLRKPKRKIYSIFNPHNLWIVALLNLRHNQNLHRLNGEKEWENYRQIIERRKSLTSCQKFVVCCLLLIRKVTTYIVLNSIVSQGEVSKSAHVEYIKRKINSVKLDTDKDVLHAELLKPVVKQDAKWFSFFYSSKQVPMKSSSSSDSQYKALVHNKNTIFMLNISCASKELHQRRRNQICLGKLYSRCYWISLLAGKKLFEWASWI